MSGSPAPGSGVPGAPPALQRPLTEADGDIVEPRALQSHDPEPLAASNEADAATSGHPWPLCALAAAALGAGIEVSRYFARRR